MTLVRQELAKQVVEAEPVMLAFKWINEQA
ncbi:hypothetical protein D018_3503A, partial [Vibrio parahaemolyticus VP2007-007]